MDRRSIPWVDRCKGLGIYLVVLGHANINLTLYHLVYLFHMPLFFFLSGYLHTTRRDLRLYCKRKAIHLLLPYASFLVLFYALEVGRVLFRYGAGHAFAAALLAGLWGGARLQGLYGVFWFLPCLFMTQQIMNLVLARYRATAVTAVVFLAMLLSYLNASLAPRLSLPLDANVVLAAMPFFYIGFLAKEIPETLHRMLLMIAAIGAALACYLVHLSAPISYNMREGIYGIPGLSFVLATCCIVCLIAVSKISPAQGLLARLGGASMGIMFLHKELPVIAPLHRWATAHGYAASILLTAISLLLTELLARSAPMRGLLLGSEVDFRNLSAGIRG